MRPHLLLAFLCALLLFRFGNLPAQESGGQNQAPQAQMLSFLSASDREKFMAARTKALNDNPDLKADDATMQQQRPGPGATPQDRQAYREKWAAHRQKLREVMVQDDPSVAAIYDQIDKHLMQMRAQQQASGGTSAQ